MKENIKNLIDKLYIKHSLSLLEYKELIEGFSEKTLDYIKEKAVALRKEVYGNEIYIRGLIEISNYCKNNCLYCGIRRENAKCSRYRLEKEDILNCAEIGYNLGFRTFVLQGGEDMYFTDEVLIDIISSLKKSYPECAITLSLGERSKESYQALFDAGADRYLLRHETADSEHYSKLHPKEITLQNRLTCLENLKGIGFQTGMGFMVGSPYQTVETLAKDLKLIEEFSPDMCGIGPFIPHSETPFKEKPAGNVYTTLYLLSIIRLIKPNILLPATTALGTLREDGCELGILSGANVIMPNISPKDVRHKYELYSGKIVRGLETAEGLNKLKNKMQKIGYKIVVAKGDIKI